jgi:Ca2+-binding RTX toxin-like protein
VSFLLALALPASGNADVPTCEGRPATLVRLGKGVTVRGTAKADVIVTGTGDNIVNGGAGNDRICTGAGEDRVYGGLGGDLVSTGGGADLVEGENGSDHVRGGGGRDRILGNRGNDRLFGEDGGRDFVDGGLGDDTAAGGGGSFDQMIGSVGNDGLYGGPGYGDAMRGDRGGDLFDGGPGEHDEASFAVSGTSGEGVVVDLGAGLAVGDGTDELRGTEDVVGTPFRDTISGGGGANQIYGGGGDDRLSGSGPGDFAFGGPGSDECAGFAGTDSCGPEPLAFVPRVEVDLPGGPASTTLTGVFRPAAIPPSGGPPQPEPEGGVHIAVSFEQEAWVVRTAPLPIVAGVRCTLVTAAEARCPVQATPDALYLGGSRKGDLLEVGAAVPDAVSAQLRGEYGNDTLLGGPGDDSLDGSPNEAGAADVLRGRGGDDALVSGVLLAGGAGSDLLIADACSGQTVAGGGGIDSASFARSLIAVQARLGGTAVNAAGRDFPAGCGQAGVPPTRIEGSVERIEGSRLDDVLIGNGAANTLLGRNGDDRLLGGGGGDVLVGGGGRDRFEGGAGLDRLYGRDGVRDTRLDCGPGRPSGGVAKADADDPVSARCRVRG